MRQQFEGNRESSTRNKSTSHFKFVSQHVRTGPVVHSVSRKKMHACLNSLVLRARSHRNGTFWLFSLLCEDNAGCGTVERTGVHRDSTGDSLSQAPVTHQQERLGESAESLQLHFKEVRAALERRQLRTHESPKLSGFQSRSPVALVGAEMPHWARRLVVFPLSASLIRRGLHAPCLHKSPPLPQIIRDS